MGFFTQFFCECKYEKYVKSKDSYAQMFAINFLLCDGDSISPSVAIIFKNYSIVFIFYMYFGRTENIALETLSILGQRDTVMQSVVRQPFYT